MDDSTAKSVEETFGREFLQYCFRDNVLIQQDDQGAFLTSNCNVLTQCIHALDDIKLETNKNLKRIQKYALGKKCKNHKSKFLQSVHTFYTHNIRRQKRFKRKATKSKKVDEKLISLTDSQLHIVLYGTCPILPTYKSSVTHILNSNRSGYEIYKFITKTAIPELLIDHEVCSPLISPLLEEFKQRHNNYHYANNLKHIIKKEKSNKKLIYRYGVTKEHFKLFFSSIFYRVVPLKIFGKIRNLKKIKKTVFELLYAPHFQAFSLMPLVNKLDIGCITWLKNVKRYEEKRCTIAKFIRWFFIGYILKILYICFHITSASQKNNERLYIPRYIWKNIQDNFIRKRIRSSALQPDVKCKLWSPPVGMYKLVPKQSGHRIIFIPQYEKAGKKDLNIIFQFLRQLHITEYGSSTFQRKWKSIVKSKNNLKQKYVVCCDVVNAFGSVKQAKLYEIITSFCEKLAERLILRFYAVKSKRFKDETICYKEYIADPNLKLPLAPGILYAYPKHGLCQWIKKKWLLGKIARYIFGQRVKINKKNYIVGKGLVQGSVLSPILSEIYYDFMIHNELKTFLEAGEIIKYMDDILYVTEDETMAKQFLELTQKGIPKYNCFFGKLKTQTNVVYNGNTSLNVINYIGYKINCTTLEVEPKESSVNLRCTMSFRGKESMPPLQFLKQRLSNVAPLKLTKFLIDGSVNSKNTIIKILEKKSVVQAKRACILIKELFNNNIQRNVRYIHEVITTTNARIARYILRSLIFRRKMKRLYMCKWNIQILSIFWKSYKSVLMEDQILKRHFACIIKPYRRLNK